MKRTFLMVALLGLATFANAQYALQFGAAVAVDGNEVYVGEGRNLLQNGSVFVYAADADGTWNLTEKIQASDPIESGNGFGRSIKIKNDRMVVGAPAVNAVYVFDRAADGSWVESAKLETDAQGLGSNVFVYDDHVIASAGGGRRDPGSSVHSWSLMGGNWEYSGELKSTLGEGRTGFGSAIDMYGPSAAIGSPSANGTGAVEIFNFENGTWSAAGAILNDDASEGSRYGSAVLLADGYLVVGMPGYRTGAGAAVSYMLNKDSGEWEFQHQLEAFDSRPNELFGSSLIGWGLNLIVGAAAYGDRSGTLYSYTFDLETDRMSRSEMIQPASLQYRSGYGTVVAMNDKVAVVGAQGHDNFEGAAFPYTISNGEWIEGNAVFSDSGVFESITGEKIECEESEAGGFPCEDVDMLSFLSRSDVGAKRGIQMNDVWGWEDPDTGIEYAVVGRTDGTSFISLKDPSNPTFVADMPYSATGHQSLHRDMKVYQNYAYIVADGAGAHHMQVFDLTRLRNIMNAPETVEADNIYKGIYSSHNLIINEESGFLYAVGSDSGGESCGGALHMIDLADPLNPEFAGCFNEPRTGRGGSGATHDAQCVNYIGPDSDYAGREICLSSNGTALSVADVTDKSNPVAISVADYPSVAYAHQGWLTEDHRFFYLNDEGDEGAGLTEGTRTIIFDLTDLDEPVLSGMHIADDNAIDHNLYVRDDLMYQTNYLAGLRILDVSDPENPVEVGTFDTVPYGPNDNSPVLGAWSNYPYFKSGVIVVTSGREGVFFLKKKEIDT